ncbi:DeoR/GlpR family DNA-binding transcription regulator [Vaginisenegalia massiliensis]|uniref:DeoR/GlpR family DNA-binding transcription regulator n=1 Tax=Vaginisenegalia massiliensis TaxID=2058294 RepID=UPI000F529A54|nr:DeoR/GlpR family DNA-binding transcription regulator [Vaginisenegalia massiliensis]
MKNSLEDIKERRENILSILRQSPQTKISVEQLAQELSVSAMTIRRDLTVLAQMGLVNRGHGFANINEEPHFEGNTHNPCLEQIKQRIAQHAAKYLKDNMTLFINTSMTALTCMDYLADVPLTVISNNLLISQMPVNSHSTFILLGGEIRFPKKALVGDLTVESLSNMNADVLIMGCSGFSASKGLTTSNIHEAKVNRLMIQNTRQLVIVVADYRKIGHNANFVVSDLSQIDILITDVFCDAQAIKEIEAQGVTVVQVDLE